MARIIATHSAFSAPRSGVEFRLIRLLGIHASTREVSALLGVSHHTLAALERSAAPVPEPRATEWRRALALAAAQRRTQLAREGITDRELAGTDFQRAYAALTTLRSA